MQEETLEMHETLFETERLVARQWRTDDADVAAAHAMYGDPEVVRYIGNRLQPTPEATRDFLRTVLARWEGTPWGGFALEEKATGQVVGAVLIRPLPDAEGATTEDIEIGWHLARAAWGRGFATEAGRGALHYAFEERGLGQLWALVEPPNARSHAVARRLGMRHLGRTERYYGGVPLELYQLDRDEWRAPA